MNTTTRTAADAEAGCCLTVATAATARQVADLLQARAIAKHLTGLGVAKNRVAAALDEITEAAVVRVASPDGVFALVIPQVGRAFPVLFKGRRTGALDVRRVPATSDSSTATHYAHYLRDRAAL